jgi:hypothetical protein
MKRVIFVIGLLMLTTLAHPQKAASTQPVWLFDIPTAPVRLTLSKRNYLFFNNPGNGEVAVVQLGLIKIENEKYKIVSTKSLIKLNLPVGHAQLVGIVDYLKDIDSAVHENAKLSIIMVKFSDGSVWHASNNCTATGY